MISCEKSTVNAVNRNAIAKSLTSHPRQPSLSYFRTWERCNADDEVEREARGLYNEAQNLNFELDAPLTLILFNARVRGNVRYELQLSNTVVVLAFTTKFDFRTTQTACYLEPRNTACDWLQIRCKKKVFKMAIRLVTPTLISRYISWPWDFG